MTSRCAIFAAAVGVATATALAGTPAAGTAGASFSNPGSIDVPDRLHHVGNWSSITIPDHGPASTYPWSVDASGLVGTVSYVALYLDGVTHTNVTDLDILLVSPDNTMVKLMSDGGGGAISYGQLSFSDNASATYAQDSTAIGYHLPTDYDGGDTDTFFDVIPDGTSLGTSLSVLKGESPNGTWKLFVTDDSATNAGSVMSWHLFIGTTETASRYPAPISVSGLGTVTDVDVTLHGFSHPSPADLDLLLVGPHGQRAVIVSDVGYYYPVAGLDLRLDDEASESIPETTLLSSGTWRPTDGELDGWGPDDDWFPGAPGSTNGDGSALSVFDGADPNGTWKLYATDDGYSDVGGITGGWSLHLTTADMPAPSVPGPAATPTTPTTPTSPAAVPTTNPTDTTAPLVDATTPRKGVTGVKRGVTVKATFSEGMLPSSLTRSTVRLVRKGTRWTVDATVTYQPATDRVLLDPARRLRPRTTYQIVVTTGAKDRAGNRLDQDRSTAGHQRLLRTFTTGG